MTAYKLTANSTAKYGLIEGNSGSDDSLDTAGYTLAPASGSIAVTLTLANAPAGSGIVINNSGTITGTSSRVIDVGTASNANVTATGAKITLNNTGTIQSSGTSKGDLFRVNFDMPQGIVTVNNQGTMKSTVNSNDSQGVRLGKVYTASAITITNGSATNSAALIQTNDADAIRAGGVNPNASNTAYGSSVIVNYGKIIAQDYDTPTTGTLSAINAIDIGQGQSANVDNFGTIIGDESALGAEVGYNGPPNYSATNATLTFAANYIVTNETTGVITGNNGPAISSGTASITNSGTITGKATGVASANASATITNANGTGILTTGAATITNNASGVIQGTGSIGSGATSNAVNIASGTVTNSGTIRETASASAKGGAAIVISGSTGSTVTNYGTITSAAGLAITMGSGADTVNLYTGGTINGTIDGGAGNDTLTLNAATGGPTSGTLANVTNFETLAVNAGAWTISDAESYANGVTIASGANLIIGPAGSTGAAITDNGTLTYTETGTFTKSQAITGTGTVVQAGTGTLVLSNGGNTYSGGTTLSSGTLDVATIGAAGTGAISFQSGSQSLIVEQAALGADGRFANTLAGLGAEDTIDLQGIGAATGASFDATTNMLTITGGSETETLQLDASGAPAAGYAYGVTSDSNAASPGSLVAIDKIATVTNVTAAPSSGYAKAGDTITFTLATSKAVSIGGAPPVLNLSNGGTAIYDAANSTATSLVFHSTVASGQDANGVTITSVGNAGDAQDAYHVPLDFSGATGHAAVGPTIDTTAPAVAITSSAGLTNEATQTISGTVDASTNGSPDNGSTVSVYETVNGATTLLGTATVANGAWSTNVNFSGNGNHTIFAQDTDAAGNTGTSNSVTYDLETTAPTVTITSAGGLTNQPSQTVTGSVDLSADPEAAGTTVTITDTGSNTVLGTGTVGNDGSFSVGITLSGDGPHTLQARDIDQAQNAGFATVNYTLDMTPPTPPSLALSNDTGVSQTDKVTSNPTVTYTPSANGDTLLYSLDGSTYATTAPALKTDGSQDGQHTISVEEQDQAGNVSSASSLTFTLDTTAPTTAPTIALANDTGTSSSDCVTSDPTLNVAVGTAGDVLVYKVDGASTYSTTAPVFKTDGTQDGQHTVTVAEEDPAGNIGPANSLTFTLDTTAPTAPSLTLANDTGTSSSDKVTNDPTVTYTASGSGDTLLYKADGASSFSTTAPVFKTDGTQDGSHTVSVEEVDSAGNVSAASTLTFTLDTTAPDIDFTSNGGTVNNAVQTINGFAGTENVGTTVSIFEDGGTSAVGTALVNGDGYFSATVNLGTDGTHTVTASDTDTAGNVGTADTPLTYTVNSTAPTFTPGNLVISISGDGDGSGNYGDNQATPLVLRQITTDGTFVSQIVLPQSTTVVNGVTESVISAEYGSSSEGSLQLSADGHSLVIAGYGINAATYNAGGAAVYGNAALAQSTSIQGGQYTAVPRVIAEVNANGTIDTSTVLYNVFNTNNPRSVATIDGSSFYISGQGVKGDTTQGLFYVQDGATTATSIDHSTDTRTAIIYNGQLYVSRDSKQGSGGTSNIAVYGSSLPTTSTTPAILEAIDKSVTITAANGNTINGSAVGTKVALDPNNFYFANATTLYVADGGIPKQGGVGDGGLQKWVYNGSQWTLQYTLSAGLGIVQPGADEGTTGLIGLTGRVNGNTVELYATNQTVGDTDQKYVFGITDSLSATTNSGQSFTTLVTADPDTNIRGISFAPTPLTPTLALAHDTGASATDEVTSDPTLTYTKARVTDTLLYSVNGGVYSTSAPTFTSDGTYTVSVEEKDKGGNFGPSNSLTFTLDTHAPAAPNTPALDPDSDTGTSSSDWLTNDTTPSITGTAEAGSTVTLRDGTMIVGTAIAGTDGSYSITTSALGDGKHSLTATATDTAGNTSVASGPLTITIDTSAPATPAAPALTTASDTGTSSSDGITNDATPTVTGTAEAGSTVTLLDGTTIVGTATAGSGGAYTITTSTLADGTHNLTVTATDAAGNTSQASSALSITVDTAAPATPNAPTLDAGSDTGRSSADGITNDTTPTLSGSAEAGATVTLLDGSTAVGTAVAGQDGSYSVTSSTLSDGTHALSVTATDAAGNVSLASAATGVVIDTTAPSAPSSPSLTADSDSGASSSDGLTNDTTPTFSGTAEAGSTVTLLDGTTIVGTATVNSSGVYSVTSSALADGTHLMTATATDTAGNVSTASGTTQVVIDTAAPSMPSAPTLTTSSDTGASTTDGITKATTPTFTGTAETGSTITLYDGSTQVGTAVTGANGGYSVVASTLSEGTHSLSVTATDKAGNVSAASGTTVVKIDTTAPSIPATPTLSATSDSGVSSSDRLTNVKTPTITGTTESGATVVLFEGTTKLGTAVAGSDGTYAITSATLADGVHNLTVTATDAAGNTSAASPTVSITVDTKAPTTPAAPSLAAGSDTGSSSTDNVTNVTTPTFTGSAEAGATIKLYDGTTQVGTATVGSNGTYSVTASTLTDGSHSLKVTATDAAGNVSAASAVQTITVDTSIPNAPSAPTLTAATDTGASPTDGVTRSTTLTFTGTAATGTTVTLYEGTTKLGSAVTAATGTYSITLPAQKNGLPALSNGAHNLTVTATTKAGKTSALSGTTTIAIDTQAPGAPAKPTLIASSDTGASSSDGITRVTTPTFTGTAEAGSTVTLYAGSTKVGTTSVGTDGTYSVTAATLADGPHSMTVTATDVAGNVSTVSPSLAITIDTKAPATPAVPGLASGSDTGRSTSDGITRDTTPGLTGTAEAGAIVKLYDSDGTTLLGTATASSTGVYTVVSSSLTDGTHNLRVTATDKAGNVSALSAARTIIVDTSAPATPAAPTLTAASDTGASSSDLITRDTTPTFTGSAEAGATVTLFDGTKAVGIALAGANGAYSVTSLALADGSHALTVTATDAAGNVSTPSAKTTVVVDAKAPAAPTIRLANDTGASSTDRYTRDPALAITAEAGATVVYYDSKTKTYISAPPQFATDGSQDGQHTVTVRAIDAAGNISASSSLTFVLDTKAPKVAINGTGGTVTTANQTISGTGEAGTTITLSDNGQAIGTAAVSSKGKWSKAVTLASGSNAVTASDTDKVGNIGTSQTVTYQYGATAHVSSLNSMVQAMATMSDSSSATMTPTASSSNAEPHPLAAAH